MYNLYCHKWQLLFVFERAIAIKQSEIFKVTNRNLMYKQITIKVKCSFLSGIVETS